MAGKYSVESSSLSYREPTGGTVYVNISPPPGFYPSIYIFAGLADTSVSRGSIDLILQDKNTSKNIGSFPRFWSKYMYDQASWGISNIYINANVIFRLRLRDIEVADALEIGYYATREDGT